MGVIEGEFSADKPGKWLRNQRIKKFLGWCVHLYTALGLVCAAGMAVTIVKGTAVSLHRALVLMLVATFIDATDGTLARAIHIKETLPGFDGRRLDDLIDFLTYTALPLLLIWRADILPPGWEGWLLLPLVASAYGFCQISAKTPDGYFLGFPSYWNVVALYLYLLHEYVRPLPWWLSLGLLVGLALLTFLPTRYLYTSQKGRLNQVTNVLACLWAAILIWILYRIHLLVNSTTQPGSDRLVRWLILGSLFFPLYYLVVSWIVSVLLWKKRFYGARED